MTHIIKLIACIFLGTLVISGMSRANGEATQTKEADTCNVVYDINQYNSTIDMMAEVLVLHQKANINIKLAAALTPTERAKFEMSITRWEAARERK